MRKNFNTFEYIRDLGEDLVRDFEKAGKTTHPHSVGEGREIGAINKLSNILPDGVGIGSGFVIDSFGNVSSQCDIIIYEKNLCLKFNSDDNRNCYYNCESVIAVGEVKSDLTTKEFTNTLKKIKKIKNLKRYTDKQNIFRRYLSPNGLIGTESEQINQLKNELDQIFTFLICSSFAINIETLIDIINSTKQEDYELINSIISVDGKYIGFAKTCADGTYSKTVSRLNADILIFSEDKNSFSKLLEQLFFVINYGRTSAYNPSIYISEGIPYSAAIFPLE